MNGHSNPINRGDHVQKGSRRAYIGRAVSVAIDGFHNYVYTRVSQGNDDRVSSYRPNLVYISYDSKTLK